MASHPPRLVYFEINSLYLIILSLEIRYFPVGLAPETEKMSCDLAIVNFVEPTAAVSCSFHVFIIISAFIEGVFP